VCGGQVHAPLDSLAKTKEDGGVFEYFFMGVRNQERRSGNSEQQIPPLRFAPVAMTTHLDCGQWMAPVGMTIIGRC
jgi:hypothetical protein